jgi:hypothetical protein
LATPQEGPMIAPQVKRLEVARDTDERTMLDG